VLLDPCCHGKDVGIEDDVIRWEAQLLREHGIGSLAYFDTSFKGFCLTLLIERHDDHGGAVSACCLRVGPEFLFSFFQADGVDNGLALYAAQSCLDHVPTRRIDHDRNACNIRLSGNQIQEAGHGMDGVQKPLIHVDINELCSRFDLLTSD